MFCLANASLLGANFAQLWEFHDKRQFKKLETTARQSLTNLGYTNKQSKKIASHIVAAYKAHGKIDDTVFSKKNKPFDKKLIKSSKLKITNEMDTAFKLAGLKNHQTLSHYHCAWWIDFSFTHISQNKLYYVLIIWHIFMLHLHKFKKIIPAILATKKLCFAGIYGHNERNTKRMVNELTSVWQIYLEVDPKPFIF